MILTQIDKILSYARTDPGLCRNINQDAIGGFVNGKMGLFIVADGIGGHSHGEIASNAVISAFEEFWQRIMNTGKPPEFGILTDMVQQVLYQVNQKIYMQYNKNNICGTTAVVLLIKNNQYAIFSVGDSHIYTLQKRKLVLKTVDDVWDNLPETMNHYTAKEIAENPNRGKLTQAVGISENMNIHVCTARIETGQAFLLCSDGLYKYCEDRLIKKTLKQTRSEKAAQLAIENMIHRVFSKGAPDNISAIFVKIV